MFVPRLVGLMVGWMEEPMDGPWHSASEAPLPLLPTPQLPPALRPAISAIAIIRKQKKRHAITLPGHYGTSFEEQKMVGKQSAEGNLGLCLSPQTYCRWVFILSPSFFVFEHFKRHL